MYKSYMSEQWGAWAQYCRAQAGFYRDNVPKRWRREQEIAAHQAGVEQIPFAMLFRPSPVVETRLLPHPRGWDSINTPEVRALLEEAAQ